MNEFNVETYHNELINKLENYRDTEIDNDIKNKLTAIIEGEQQFYNKHQSQYITAIQQKELADAYGYIYNNQNKLKNTDLATLAYNMQHGRMPDRETLNILGIYNYPSQAGMTQPVNGIITNTWGGRRRRRSKTNKRKASRHRKASRRAATRHRRRN